MFVLQGKFRFVPKEMPQEPEDWWPARVHANLTSALENQAEFPERLSPDAWKWHRSVPYDQLPLEVTHVPLGSWLAARLAFIAGDEDALRGLLLEQVKATADGHEFSLALGVFTPSEDDQLAAIYLVLDAEQIRIEGFSTAEYARAIDDDLMSALCHRALEDLALCALPLDDKTIGYDGQRFYGERQRVSRFEEIVAEERRVHDLAAENIELPPGEDGPATHPELLRQLGEYIRAETADGQFILDNLQYLRSAKLDDTYYLIWEYRETAGRRCYATFAHAPTGDVMSYNDAGELTPEQYIYADYKQWF